jgi:hypothetical protein
MIKIIKYELYAQHLNEAIKLNNNYFFLVQDIVDFNETHVEKNKVFKLNNQNLESSFMNFFYDLIESTKKVRIEYFIKIFNFKEISILHSKKNGASNKK